MLWIEDSYLIDPNKQWFEVKKKNLKYTVPCENIHTSSFFSRFMLLPYVKLL